MWKKPLRFDAGDGQVKILFGINHIGFYKNEKVVGRIHFARKDLDDDPILAMRKMMHAKITALEDEISKKTTLLDVLKFIINNNASDMEKTFGNVARSIKNNEFASDEWR